MKESQYNFFYPHYVDKEKIVCYNSRSNALALMDINKFKIFKNYVNDGEEIKDEEFINDLCKGFFLINKSIDEKEILRHQMNVARYNTSSLGLTIAPTADCNFRCKYCYEKDVIKPKYMNDDIANSIFTLIENQINQIRNLSITWYGGEPLMAFERITSLSNKIIEICTENDVNYSAGMITNGYFLTKDVLEQLAKIKVFFLQITLDGDKDTHNKRRPLTDGSGTYETIINNLISNKDILPRISLRINIDKNNENAGYDILEMLRKNNLMEKTDPYLGQITSDGTYYHKDDCFQTKDFSNINYDYISSLNEKKILQQYPTLRRTVCGADNLNAIVVDAEGYLYKCWTDIGDLSKSYASLVDDNNKNITGLPTYLKYMNSDPTQYEICSNCKFLPVCMGGCPQRRFDYIESNEFSDTCIQYKYLIEKYIPGFVKELEMNKN